MPKIDDDLKQTNTDNIVRPPFLFFGPIAKICHNDKVKDTNKKLTDDELNQIYQSWIKSIKDLKKHINLFADEMIEFCQIKQYILEAINTLQDHRKLDNNIESIARRVWNLVYGLKFSLKEINERYQVEDFRKTMYNKEIEGIKKDINQKIMRETKSDKFWRGKITNGLVLGLYHKLKLDNFNDKLVDPDTTIEEKSSLESKINIVEKLLTPTYEHCLKKRMYTKDDEHYVKREHAARALLYGIFEENGKIPINIFTNVLLRVLGEYNYASEYENCMLDKEYDLYLKDYENWLPNPQEVYDKLGIHLAEITE
ncbi:MAG: hypothetical protein ACFFDF_25625, partial [Candidatus Odinarchaeota archaeon]